MDLNYSTEELAFRDEVRSWLRGNLPDELRQKMESYQELSKDDLLRWHKILAQKGWVAPDWPEEWGGTELERRAALHLRRGVRLRGHAAARSRSACACARPSFSQFGTEAQKQRFLPRIYDGDRLLVPGLLGAGLGLGPRLAEDAGARGTTATTWSPARRSGPRSPTTPTGSSASCAPTPNTGKRQDGISLPAHRHAARPASPCGPSSSWTAATEVNEVFFDEVKVPVENLVHEEGKGWTVAKYLLGYERMGTGRIGASKRELARLEGAGRATDEGRPAAPRRSALPRPSHRGSRSS